MANSNTVRAIDSDTGATAWTQPMRGLSVSIPENERGYIVQVPDSPLVAAVAAAMGDDAARVTLNALIALASAEIDRALTSEVKKENNPDKEMEIINSIVTKAVQGTLSTSHVNMYDAYNKALFNVLKTHFDAIATERGNAAPTEAAVKDVLRDSYDVVNARHGHKVFGTTFVPTKKETTKKAAKAATVSVDDI
jgi:hypothetical protein